MEGYRGCNGFWAMCIEQLGGTIRIIIKRRASQTEIEIVSWGGAEVEFWKKEVTGELRKEERKKGRKKDRGTRRRSSGVSLALVSKVEWPKRGRQRGPSRRARVSNGTSASEKGPLLLPHYIVYLSGNLSFQFVQAAALSLVVELHLPL